jgi:hypothetical protein
MIVGHRYLKLFNWVNRILRISFFSGFLTKPEKPNLPDGRKKYRITTIKSFRRRRIEFHHFLLESDERKNPNNPVNPVYYFSLKIASIP